MVDPAVARAAAKKTWAKVDSRDQMHRLAEWLVFNEPHLLSQGIPNGEVVADIVIRLLNEWKVASDASCDLFSPIDVSTVHTGSLRETERR